MSCFEKISFKGGPQNRLDAPGADNQANAKRPLCLSLLVSETTREIEVRRSPAIICSQSRSHRAQGAILEYSRNVWSVVSSAVYILASVAPSEV